MKPVLQKIDLSATAVEALRREARAEGYNFIETLVGDWRTGANRFDGPGETLLGCFDGDLLVAVGGLNVDPFAGNARVGRIRRVYVRAAWRGRGVGRVLVTALIEAAGAHFDRVRLRAENAGAARLYERIGFAITTEPDATHVLRLEKDPSA